MPLRVDKKRSKLEIAYVRGAVLLLKELRAAAADQMCDRNGKKRHVRRRRPLQKA